MEQKLFLSDYNLNRKKNKLRVFLISLMIVRKEMNQKLLNLIF